MNKNLAIAIGLHVEANVSAKDIRKNNKLVPELHSFKEYLSSGEYSTTEAKARTEKLIRQCPKFLRRELHSLFFPKKEQEALIEKRKTMSAPTEYERTNIRFPWQGGAPGLKK